MHYDRITPRKSKQLGDLVISVPQPYLAGHTITEGEASALNQVLAENLGNNLRAKLAAGDNGVPFTQDSAQALADTYLAAYEMGVRQVGTGESRVADPIEREARKLAKDKAKELVKAAGRKLNEVNLTEIADTIYDNNIDALTAAAKKIVDARKKAATATSDGIDVSSITINDKAPAVTA